MELFKFCLVRISGIAYSEMKMLECAESVDLIKQLLTAEEQKAKLTELLCNELYHVINKVAEKKDQQTLLILKRNIFNGRISGDENFDGLNSLLSDELYLAFGQYLKVVKQLANLQHEGQKVYLKESILMRQHFKSLIQSNDFRNGLLLASHDLLKSATHYHAAPNDVFSKKTVKTELGLLKYFSRAATKTSPFSTFTTLSIAEISDGNGQGIYTVNGPANDDYSIISRIRLNNGILLLIRNILLKYPAYYGKLSLCVNTTVKIEEDNLVFLVNSANSESFQRIGNSLLLKAIIGLTSKERITFNQLLDQLQELTEATEGELTDYVRQLIELGLLEFAFPISGTDPFWDIKLIEHLNAHESETALKEFALKLSLLRGQAAAYEAAGTTKRIEILKDAYETCVDAITDLHIAAGLPQKEREIIRYYIKKDHNNAGEAKGNERDSKSKEENNVFYHSFRTSYYIKPESFFYEDTKRDFPITISSGFIQSIADILGNVNRKFSHWGYFDEEIEKLKHFFLENFGKDACVSVLAFYEAIYKNGPKGNSGATVNGASLNDIIALTQKRDLFTRTITQLIELHRQNPSYGAAVFNFDLITLKQLDIPEKQRNDRVKYSFAGFIQPFLANGLAGAVLNNGMAVGYGKLMSRFLHLFEKNVTTDIRTTNNFLCDDVLCIENTDASFFNANIHPHLMNSEIRVPGGHNTHDNDSLIPVSDILLNYDESEDSLVLTERHSQKRVFIFDLCFEGSDTRSPLFRLLSLFSSMFPSGGLDMINLSVNEAYKAAQTQAGNTPGKQVTVQPRIVIDHKLVVQRKRWLLPKELLPEYESEATEWDIFNLLNKWRMQYGLPDEVFVKITERFRVKPEKTGTDNSKRDDYKPQYINFNIPMLVNLLYKSFDRTPGQLVVEEMLPGRDEIFPVNRTQFSTELLIQWYE